MAGELRPTGGGCPEPFAFTVRARGRRARHLLTGAPFELDGTITLTSAESPVDGAPCHGTLRSAPFGERALTYELQWRDMEGRPCRFYGTKNLATLRVLRAMTLLEGTVYRHGEPLGMAKLRFDLHDIPSFLASFRPTH